MSKRSISFYSTQDAYGEFSNFAAFPIEIDGRTWPTSEHYFQAQKFIGTEHEELIRTTPSPMAAAKIGRDRKRPLRPDWEEIKDCVMRKAVWAKFNQHPQLATMLIETGDAVIVEHTHNDALGRRRRRQRRKSSWTGSDGRANGTTECPEELDWSTAPEPYATFRAPRPPGPRAQNQRSPAAKLRGGSAAPFPSPLVGEGGSLTRSGSETDEGSVTASDAH